jgi:hypothetical protein
MDNYDRNIKKELEDYEKNKKFNDTNFLEQFKLQKLSDNNTSHFDKFHNIDSSYTYGVVEPKDFTMHPANYFDMLNLLPGSRRDNSVVINEYFRNNESKKELDSFYDVEKNDEALLASGVKYNRLLDKNRFSNNAKYRNNDYLTDYMYVRPESLDGTPLTDFVRVREKDINQLRGQHPDSQPLQAKEIKNHVKKNGEGVSQNPENITITKFKLPDFKEQQPADLLRTTGAFLKPEWYSKVQEPRTNRTISKQIQGPAKSQFSTSEYRNNQPANATGRSEQNIHIAPPKSYIPQPEHRNNQEANPTGRMNENNYISNPKTQTNKPMYRNNQIANITQREFEQKYLSNSKAFVNLPDKRNNQPANATQREEFQQVTNPKGIVERPYYHNEQPANPTIRQDTGETTYIGSNLMTSRGIVYENNQPANMTLRQETQFNKYLGHSYNNGGIVYENKQPANMTLRENNNNYDGIASNTNTGYVYKNNQPANDTIREETQNNEQFGPSYTNAGPVYNNNQPANMTHREGTAKTYSGHGMRERTYLNQQDDTRGTQYEDIAAKDYKGVDRSYVDKGQSRLNIKNFEHSERKEKALNLQERQLGGGGYGQIGSGTDIYGAVESNLLREVEQSVLIPQAFVARPYKETELTRGKILLQERDKINPYVPTIMDGNPYVNNMVHKSLSNNDVIRETTLLSDRILEDEKENNDLQDKFNKLYQSYQS